PSLVGQSVTLTAIIDADAPPGTIVFREGQLAVLGCFTTVPVTAGQASCTTTTMAPGTHSIAAIYNDTEGAIVASTYLTQVVNAGMWVTSTGSPSGSGQSVTFTATAGGNAPKGGTVDFLDGAAGICTGKKLLALTTNTGIATCSTATLAPGTHSITAR